MVETDDEASGLKRLYDNVLRQRLREAASELRLFGDQRPHLLLRRRS